MLQGKALYVTCEETSFNMTADGWVEVAELQTTQEESDTRLLLHALHAAITGSKAVIVTPEDTDAMLLCHAFQKDILCPIYQNIVGHRTAHDLSISANWPGQWETAFVTAYLGYMPLQAVTP